MPTTMQSWPISTPRLKPKRGGDTADEKSIQNLLAIFVLCLENIQIGDLSAKPAHKLEKNESSRIIRFDDSVIAGKLMSMGILPQAKMELVLRNALGQTLVYRINSRFKIVLRKDEAKTIIVETS